MKKFLLITAVLTIAFNTLSAQCTSSFTFTYASGGHVNFSSTSVNTTTNTKVSWIFGNDEYDYNSNNVTGTYTSNGSYVVTLNLIDTINTSLCASTSTQMVNITNTTCTSPINFTMYKDTSQTSPSWIANPNYPSNVSAAEWFWGDASSTVGLYPPVHTYSSVGVYSVCVSMTVSCGSSSVFCLNQPIFRSSESMVMATLKVVDPNAPTSVKINSKNKPSFTIYPNPANNKITIETKGNDILQCNLLNALGQFIQSYTIDNRSKTLDVTDIAAGLYFITLSNDNKVFETKKLVISK